MVAGKEWSILLDRQAPMASCEEIGVSWYTFLYVYMRGEMYATDTCQYVQVLDILANS
jgi:hypothetical protein